MPERSYSLSKAIREALNDGKLTGLERDVHYTLQREAKAMLGQLGLPELSERQLRDELTVPLPNGVSSNANETAGTHEKPADRAPLR